MSAYDRGAHTYQGTTNSHSQRSLSKAYRGVTARVTVEQLERLLATGTEAPMHEPDPVRAYIRELEARITTLEARLARARRDRDRLRQRLGRRVPQGPRPPRDRRDEDGLHEAGFY